MRGIAVLVDKQTINHMGSSIIRNTIGALVLIVLSFLIGIMAADSAKQAASIIIVSAAMIGFIAMGKHVWITLFLLPPICRLLPTVGGLPVSYALYTTVLLYWLLLRLLGHVRFTWRKLIGADLIVIALTILIAIAFYRRPASVEALNHLLDIKTDYIDGKAFPVFVFSLILYLCFSCIPFKENTLIKLLKWNLILQLTSTFILGLFSVRETVEQENSEYLQYGMFRDFGELLFIAVYCSAPFIKLIVSPKAILGICVAITTTLFSGFRSMLAQFGLLVIAACVIKKEYCAFITSLFIGIILIGIMHASDSIKILPYQAQRALCLIPGLAVEQNIRKGTNDSTDWRVEMWKRALDSRTGYIKDYILGDGFGIEKAYHARSSRSRMRGQITNGDPKDYAETRMWHSLFIDTLQSLGCLGLLVVYGGALYATFVLYKVNTALRDTPFFIYSMIFTCKIAVYSIYFFLSTYSLYIFLYTLLSHLAYLKVFHNLAVDEGKIVPRGKKAQYIPLLIKQQQYT